jgi:hypothetical protein
MATSGDFNLAVDTDDVVIAVEYVFGVYCGSRKGKGEHRRALLYQRVSGR